MWISCVKKKDVCIDTCRSTEQNTGGSNAAMSIKVYNLNINKRPLSCPLCPCPPSKRECVCVCVCLCVSVCGCVSDK